jgi:hypothetical protein
MGAGRVSGTRLKAVQLLRERLRQLLRVVIVLAACVAVAATALAIRWLNNLARRSRNKKGS